MKFRKRLDEAHKNIFGGLHVDPRAASDNAHMHYVLPADAKLIKCLKDTNGEYVPMWNPEQEGGHDRWEEILWHDLYGDETSLDGKLLRIGERLELKSMPWLRTPEKKWTYLGQLEDQYYDKVYHECLEY